MMGMELTGRPPFHTVYLHGKGPPGRKISLVLGGVVPERLSHGWVSPRVFELRASCSRLRHRCRWCAMFPPKESLVESVWCELWVGPARASWVMEDDTHDWEWGG